MLRTLPFSDEFTIKRMTEELSLLKEAVEQCEEVAVDLANVREVDVAADPMLIATQKECKRNGHRITIRKSDTLADFLSHIGVRL